MVVEQIIRAYKCGVLDGKVEKNEQWWAFERIFFI